MKPKDFLAIAYFVAITAFLVFQTELFVSMTKTHPYIMGFTKFALLATFGECLKHRLATSNWIPSRLPVRFMVWGIFGLWITTAFSFVDGGVKAIAAANLWSEPSPFWMSSWINFLGGYGFFMMFSHYWLDNLIAGKMVWPWELMGMTQTQRWAKIVIISLFVFWIPAHTLTFSLPSVWRVICAAYLSVALGLILSFAARRT